MEKMEWKEAKKEGIINKEDVDVKEGRRKQINMKLEEKREEVGEGEEQGED